MEIGEPNSLADTRTHLPNSRDASITQAYQLAYELKRTHVNTGNHLLITLTYDTENPLMKAGLEPKINHIFFEVLEKAPPAERIMYTLTFSPKASFTSTQSPSPKRTTNDESELITDRSDQKIDEFLNRQNSFSELQSLYMTFRNSKSGANLTTEKAQWATKVDECCNTINWLLISRQITSQEKVNASKTYLQGLKEYGNQVVDRAKKGNKPVNFTREIRKIFTK